MLLAAFTLWIVEMLINRRRPRFPRLVALNMCFDWHRCLDGRKRKVDLRLHRESIHVLVVIPAML